MFDFEIQSKIITTRECCFGEVSILNGATKVGVPNDYVALRNESDHDYDNDSDGNPEHSIADEFCSITIPGTKLILEVPINTGTG